jgi:hypothetical protein
MLTAGPAASRACVSAATGPVKAHLATLLTALAASAVLALAGACYELLTSGNLRLVAARGALPGALGSGLGAAFVCLLVGSAVGTLFNAPVIRHPTVALLSTIAAVVVALVSGVSPANAALRGNGATLQSPRGRRRARAGSPDPGRDRVDGLRGTRESPLGVTRSPKKQDKTDRRDDRAGSGSGYPGSEPPVG